MLEWALASAEHGMREVLGSYRDLKGMTCGLCCYFSQYRVLGVIKGFDSHVSRMETE